MKYPHPIFLKIKSELLSNGFRFERTDYNRPWGGFFVILESQAPEFIEKYFPNEKITDLTRDGKVSPKILIVLPNKRLSWQYHHRRSEVWKAVDSSVGVVKSNTDKQGEMITLKDGDKVVLAKGERHRLVGLEGIGIVAEIWQHTDPDNPSDEEDIVRLQDDFGR